jgi:hypothetical protein
VNDCLSAGPLIRSRLVDLRAILYSVGLGLLSFRFLLRSCVFCNLIEMLPRLNANGNSIHDGEQHSINLETERCN